MKRFIVELGISVAAMSIGVVILLAFEVMYRMIAGVKKSSARFLPRIIIYGSIFVTIGDIISLHDDSEILLCNLSGFLKVFGFGLVNFACFLGCGKCFAQHCESSMRQPIIFSNCFKMCLECKVSCIGQLIPWISSLVCAFIPLLGQYFDCQCSSNTVNIMFNTKNQGYQTTHDLYYVFLFMLQALMAADMIAQKNNTARGFLFYPSSVFFGSVVPLLCTYFGNITHHATIINKEEESITELCYYILNKVVYIINALFLFVIVAIDVRSSMMDDRSNNNNNQAQVVVCGSVL